MMRSSLWIMLMFAFVLFTFACGGPSTDGTQEEKKSLETADDETKGEVPTDIPAIAPAGAGKYAPGTVVGGAVTDLAADGTTSTTFIEGGSLESFLKGVITNDTDAIKANCTEELYENLDKIIEELGFREFVEDDDYDALWEKLKPPTNSDVTVTALGGTMSMGFWNVFGEPTGLKDLAVQFEMTGDENGFKVSAYAIMIP